MSFYQNLAPWSTLLLPCSLPPFPVGSPGFRLTTIFVRNGSRISRSYQSTHHHHPQYEQCWFNILFIISISTLARVSARTSCCPAWQPTSASRARKPETCCCFVKKMLSMLLLLEDAEQCSVSMLLLCCWKMLSMAIMVMCNADCAWLWKHDVTKTLLVELF